MANPETVAQLERFTRDTQYYQTHREELLRQYPDQWIAIYDRQVAGAAPNPEELLDQLEQRRIPVEHALFQYLSRQEEIWILPA